ncbi:MAG: hypothetical protein KAS32_20115 [Candidatus Peribacteraceae bacterium]|nr:hypothetical protein [Candidatus Peribacteraceae bacterium]
MTKATEHDRQVIFHKKAGEELEEWDVSTIKRLIKDSRRCEAFERMDTPNFDLGIIMLKHLNDLMHLSPRTVNELFSIECQSIMGTPVTVLNLLNSILEIARSESQLHLEKKHDVIKIIELHRRPKDL